MKQPDYFEYSDVFRVRLMRMRLKHQLQALAMPADIQLSLCPDGAAKADELTEDFHHWRLCVVGNDPGELTEEQLSCLKEIDDQTDFMSGQENAHLWTDHALRERAEWERVRNAAEEALALFGWPLEVPCNLGRTYDPSVSDPEHF